MSCPHIWTFQVQIPNFHKYFMRCEMQLPREAAFSDSLLGDTGLCWPASPLVLYRGMYHVVDRLERCLLRILVPPPSLKQIYRLCTKAWRLLLLFLLLWSDKAALQSLGCCQARESVLVQSLSQVLPGGGDREWPSNHVAILPASGHTKYGPKSRTLQPRD